MDLKQGITTTLGDHAADFDVDGIAEAILAEYPEAKTVDDVPTEDYWEIVKAYDPSGAAAPDSKSGWSQGLGMDIHQTRDGEAFCGAETTTVGDRESALDLIANHGYRMCIPCDIAASGLPS